MKDKLYRLYLKEEERRELLLILPKAIEVHNRQKSLCNALQLDEWEEAFANRKAICSRLYDLLVRVGRR
jgi:hypothetical protein